MIKLWSIARNTFLQTIRQPVYLVLVLVTFGLLVFTLPFTGYTLSVDFHETDQQMLEDLGLGTLRIAGLLIAAFSASGVLRREIEEKTALTVISKPVSRTTFVLGKFLGVTGAVAIAYYLCCLAFLLTVRHRVVSAAYDKIDWPVIVLGLSAFALAVLVSLLGNLWFGWPFTSTGVWAAVALLTAAMVVVSFVGKQWELIPFGQGISAQLVLELAMMFMAVVIFVALAIAASTRLGQTMTLLVCTAIFLLGSAHPLLIGRWAHDAFAVRVLGWVTPNFTYFYPQDDLKLAGAVPLSLVGSAGLYCVLYSAGVLAVGIALFHSRELEARTTSASMPTLVKLLAWTGRAVALAAGFIALLMLSMPRFLTLAGLLTAAGLIAAAAAGWIVWGCFSRGTRWSYWLVLCLAAANVPLAGVLLALSGGGDIGQPVGLVAWAAVAVAVLVVMVLPKTRSHFGFGRA